MSTEGATHWRDGIKAAALAAAGVFAFGPALRGGWLWDDSTEIGSNLALRSAHGLWGIWSGKSGQDYFPLKTTLQWVQWHLWQGNPAGYHLTNLGLHILGSILLWRVLSRLGVVQAWLGGMLFAVHPLTVESVAWISELKNVLSFPLLLLSLLAWLEYDETRRRAPWLKALLWFLAAMLSKTSAVMFPGLLLLHAWWKHGRPRRSDWLAAMPFFAVSLVLGLVTVRFQAHRAMAHLSIPAESLAERAAMAGSAAVFALAKALWPAGLLPIYPRWRAAPVLLGFLPGVAIVAGLAWLGARSRGRRGALFGLAAFFLNLVPVLGIAPMAFLRISRVADHFDYLPLAGLAGLAAAGAARWRAAAGPALFWASAVLVLGCCAGADRAYSAIFSSEEALWRHTLARNPAAWLAENNLGIALAQSGRTDEAILHEEKAVRLQPGFAEGHANLGLALTTAGRLPEAVAQLETALRLDPGLPGGRRNLAVALNNLGNALARQGRLTEAVDVYDRAKLADPGNAGVRRNLSFALHGLGRDQDAFEQLQAADRLEKAR